MQNYRVELVVPISDSFRAIKAANSCDLDTKSKAKHLLSIDCKIPEKYNIGVIVGNSGSGKTTLARKIFGTHFESMQFDNGKCLIDQFPETWTYEQCASALTQMGLGSVIRWLVPLNCLSNGEKYRGICALNLAHQSNPIVLDEWTSVVDRTVGNIMSNSIQKIARRNNQQIVLISCHYDILEWLNPDWVIDCNEAKFESHPVYQKKNFNSMSANVTKINGVILANITI